MTKNERLKYKRWCRKSTDVELILQSTELKKESLGSTAEEMFNRDYPPEMCQEQWQYEEDNAWCLKEIYKELKRRGTMIE